MSIFTDDMRRDPFPTYDALRPRSPMHVPIGDLWMVLDYDGVKRALTEYESFSSNVAPSRGVRFEWLLFMDPPRHEKLRAIVSRAFTPRSVAALEPRVRALTLDLLEGPLGRGEMDVVADFAAPLPMMVIAELLGLPLGDWPRLRDWSEAIINLGSTIGGSEAQGRAASEAFLAANLEMQAYLEAEVAARRAAQRDDLITRLVEAEVDGQRLDGEELLRFFQLLLAAGSETTTNLLGNAILCFLDHPAELLRVQREPSLLGSAIEEVLRHRSPAQTMFRATRREVSLGGQTIPAGKFVLVMIGAANRDPAQFADPARFDVARQPNPHLAFGHGIHFCIGAPLSRLEARVALGELLPRIGTIARLSDEPWQPRAAFQVHGATSLPIRISPPERATSRR